MNKTELIARLAKKTNLSKAVTERLINELQNEIIQQVSEGNEIKLSGFAAFTPITRKARIMKNPKTGKEQEIPETKTVNIRPLKKFKTSIQ